MEGEAGLPRPRPTPPEIRSGGEGQTGRGAGAGAGLWAECHALLQGRDGHSSWGSPAGVLLLGGYPGDGYDSLRSTELLSTTDSSSQQAFDLEYDTA